MSLVHITNVQIAPFLNARASDVQLLESLLTQRLRQSTSTAVTGVKRHLRRRTTAYRSFAMPVRAKQNPSKHQLKRRRIPFEMRCRKHRRRPHVLYKMHDMYAEECQKGVRWLDTHIWHAKRMKMVRRWGFLLPERHAARGVRASTKALKQACVLHDLSYCRVLQLVGPQAQLLRLLQSMTDPALNLQAEDGQVAFACGDEELECVLYHPCEFPRACIGPARCMLQPPVDWQADGPINSGNESTPTLWMWLHPMIYDEITELCRAAIPDLAPATAIVPLHAGLARFAIRGIESLDCVSAALGNKRPETAGPNEQFWHWNKATERLLAMWPQNRMLALNADDPRVLYEAADDQCAQQHQQQQQQCSPSRKWPSKTASVSKLWDPANREAAAKYAEEMSTNRLASERQLRRQQNRWQLSALASVVRSGTTAAASGQQRTLAAEAAAACCMPVMLIRKVGRSSGKGSVRESLAGFDVIAPRGLARFLWHALVWHGARAIGLEEWQHFHLEAGLPFFPTDFPDTAGSSTEEDEKQQPQQQQQELLNWASLFPPEETAGEGGSQPPFVVVRGKHYTDPFLVSTARPPTARLPERTPRRAQKQRRWVVRAKPGVPTTAAASGEERMLPSLPFNTLLLVWVVAASKGTPRSGDQICAPSQEDYERWNWHESHKHQPITNGQTVKTWAGCHADGNERKVLGFLTSGGRSYLYGAGVALGFCDAEALFNGLQESARATTGEGKHMLLFKDHAAQIYYPCFVHIFA